MSVECLAKRGCDRPDGCGPYRMFLIRHMSNLTQNKILTPNLCAENWAGGTSDYRVEGNIWVGCQFANRARLSAGYQGDLTGDNNPWVQCWFPLQFLTSVTPHNTGLGRGCCFLNTTKTPFKKRGKS